MLKNMKKFSEENSKKPKREVSIKPLVGMVYGKPGVGKSSFLASDERSVFIGTERNDTVNCLKHPDGIAKTYQQLLEQFEWALGLENSVANTIVVDTLSEVEHLMVESFVTKDYNLQTYGGGYGKGTENLKKIYFQFFRDYVDKAVEKNKNVIFTARIRKETETDEETGSSFTRTYPLIEKSRCYEMVCGEMDFIFALKKLAPQKTGAFVSGDTMLYTVPTAGSDAKNRFHLKKEYIILNKDNFKDVSEELKNVLMQIKQDIKSYFNNF